MKHKYAVTAEIDGHGPVTHMMAEASEDAALKRLIRAYPGRTIKDFKARSRDFETDEESTR